MATSTAATPNVQELAGIDARPNSDVLIYDAQCVFCSAQVKRIARWDTRGRLAFVSLHDPIVSERYPDLSHAQLMEQMYVVDQRDRRHGGAAAFRYLTRKLPRLFWLAPIMHIPFTLPLWQWGYRQVAKRRYKIAGKQACDGDACEVHFK